MGRSRTITRRKLLGGAAAAGAASLVGPAAGLAAKPDGARVVSDLWIGSLEGQSPPIRAPRRFVLVGLEWASPAAALIEVRAQAPSGRWSSWVPASTLGHDPDAHVSTAGRFGEPLWTGVADGLQVRSDRPVDGLRAHFVSPGPPVARAASGPPLATPILNAGPGQPPIIARQGWGGGQAQPVHTPTYGTVDLAFVHHTVNPNGYGAAQVPALLLSIFYYHVQVRGFWDIAYNFIIDLYGGIWEARAGGIDMAVIGAHAGAYNAESTGVAVLGDFMNVVPSQAAMASLQRLLAWKLSLHGLPAQGQVSVVVNPASAFYTPFPPGAHVSLPRIAGHREGDLTDCPGDALYAQLPSIRPQVASLAGVPAKLTLQTAPATPRAGMPLTVTGRLQLLTGEGLGGALVELQQLRLKGLSATAVTLATATTASDGSWSVPPFTAENTTLLRGLYRSHPAAVTDWLSIEVVPAITLTLVSASPLQVSGTITPARRVVTVDLYAAGRTGGKPVSTRKVSASSGQFSATFPHARPGNHVLVARSQAGALNAAGASPQLAVTVP
jgi:N-acetylmuramoyl-L-alanine amidase-like protein